MTVYHDKVTKEEIRECRGDWIFCDGGMIGRNPSELGGTWEEK